MSPRRNKGYFLAWWSCTRVGLSRLTKMNKVEIFYLMETFILHIEFRFPSDTFSRMYLYWEQTVTENYFEI